MVGLQVLVLAILVRIQARQQDNLKNHKLRKIIRANVHWTPALFNLISTLPPHFRVLVEQHLY